MGARIDTQGVTNTRVHHGMKKAEFYIISIF
jgi:hypothetical protein